MIRPAGDRAVLLELADNAEAVRVAARVRASLDGVCDVVPGHRTVLVTWPGPARPDELEAVVAGDDVVSAPPREHALSVVYDGPDVAEVAAFASLSPEEVVGRHAAARYVVGFLGFAPGFAYLLGGDERLHVPRREEPRARVPAGSVAVAGVYSGVYPRESPGGWRLLGRTDAVLFDPARDPPALFAAGDRVRFVAR